MTKRVLIAAAVLMMGILSLGAVGVWAQDGPAPPQTPPGAGSPRPPHMRDDGRGGPGGRGEETGGGEMHGAIGHLLPPGTWWRNPQVIERLTLTPDQQKRIDDVFVQSRMRLIDLHAGLEKEQLLLEPLLNANPVDQPKALAEIGKIADARAELEKTDAKMLLSIRAVLTADQWTKLREKPHGGPGGKRQGHGQGGGQQGPPPPPQAE